MDNLFKIRTLTAAVNAIENPAMKVFNRLFRPRAHMQASDRLAFDVISGSEGILGNVSIYAPAIVTDKTSRKTITMQAPRLSTKRLIHTAELNALRAYGSQVQIEMMKDRLNRETVDMRNEHDRTLEFWAVNALKGVIYDSDLSTELVDYNLDSDHNKTLTGDDLWSASTATPIDNLREWKRTIEDDTGAAITGWLAYCGHEVMDAMLAHEDILTLLKYDRGVQTLETGRVTRLVEIEVEEYNGSYLNASGTRKRFVSSDEIILIGLCNDIVDCPYAPVVDSDAPGGVGNVDINGAGQMFFAKSWDEKDPSGKWIKVETRPLPVLQRPGAVIRATVV